MTPCKYKGCTDPASNQVNTIPVCDNHFDDYHRCETQVEEEHFLNNCLTQNFKKHETGAVRSKDADNVRYDLISPIALRALAATYAEGAAKYEDFNWEKGFPVSNLLNHAIRHIYLFLEGDRSEPHLAHAMWNVGAAIHSFELWPHLNHNLRGPDCTPPTGD